MEPGDEGVVCSRDRVVERDVITLCYRGREARVSKLGPSVNTGVISHGLIIGEHKQ